MTRNLLMLAAAVLMLPACDKAARDEAPAAAQADTASDEQAIRGHIARWLQLLEAGDSATIAQFYADDGVVMPPNQPLVSGRDSIAKFWQSMIDMPEGSLTFATDRITFSSAGDMALDRGTYRLTGKTGGEALDSGKYVVVWRKVGGEWKVAADIFNSDQPPAGG